MKVREGLSGSIKRIDAGAKHPATARERAIKALQEIKSREAEKTVVIKVGDAMNTQILVTPATLKNYGREKIIEKALHYDNVRINTERNVQNYVGCSWDDE